MDMLLPSSIDVEKVARRLAEVAQLIRAKPHSKAKLVALQNFADFLLPYARTRVEEATPVHVVAWLAWRETHGKGKTIVHLVTCPFIGAPTVAHCDCPRRLKATTLSGLASRLRSAFRELGDRFTMPWALSMGNPADSKQVEVYLAAVTSEQQSAGVTVSQATVMLLPKLRTLLFAIRSRLGVFQLPALEFIRIHDAHYLFPVAVTGQALVLWTKAFQPIRGVGTLL